MKLKLVEFQKNQNVIVEMLTRLHEKDILF